MNILRAMYTFYFIYLFIYLAGFSKFTNKMSNPQREKRIQDITLNQYNDTIKSVIKEREKRNHGWKKKNLIVLK